MDIKKILFVFSLAGIFLLTLISNFSQPKAIEIDKINISNKNLDEKVSISGTIEEIRATKETTIITIKESETEIIAFAKNLNLKKGQKIRIEGKVDIYKGKIQVIADKIYTEEE